MPFCVTESGGFFSRISGYPCNRNAHWVIATRAEHQRYSKKATYNIRQGRPFCVLKVVGSYVKTDETYPHCKQYIGYSVGGFNQFYRQATIASKPKPAPKPTPTPGEGTVTETPSNGATASALTKSDVTDITTLLFALIMLLMFAHGFRAGNAWQ